MIERRRDGATLLGAGLRRMADLALPNRCVGCRTVIGADGALCPTCFSLLTFIGAPHCDQCGLPLPIAPSGPPIEDRLICAGCAADAPKFQQSRAALAYGGLARDIVLMLKHADRSDLARPLAGLLARAGAPLLDRADLMAPVPLHRGRLFSRRYNQAGLLAQALSRSTGVPIAVDLLRRTRATPSQGHLSAAHRRRNVRGAFSLNPRTAARVADARILLIDDVMTTGATLDACASVLLRGGATAVDALVVARVLRADLDLDSGSQESI